MTYESQSLPPPSAPRVLRLFRVLVESACHGSDPVHVATMPALPARPGCSSGRPLVMPAGPALPETHPAEPSAAVLARCVRLRQADPVCADQGAFR